MTQITDMVTLRAFALKQAVESKAHPDYILVTAGKYVAFIKGDVELPEYKNRSADTMKFYADLLKQSKESSDDWHKQLLEQDEWFAKHFNERALEKANDKIAELEKELAEYKTKIHNNHVL